MPLCLPGRSTLAAGACGLVAAAAIAGCGSAHTSAQGTPSGTSSQTVFASFTRAASVSSASQGYRASFAITESLASRGTVRVAGRGSFSVSHRSGTFTIRTVAPGTPSFGLREIVRGETFYIEFPASLASRLPGGKRWLSMNLAQLGRVDGIPELGALASNSTSENPGEYLQYLKGASRGSITRIGTARIDGVATTGYRATLSLSRAVDLLPAAKRAAARQAVAALSKQTGLTAFPAKVWIGPGHLVRRIELALHTHSPTVGAASTVIRFDFLSYGPQAVPAAPPASETLNLLSLLGRLKGTGGTATAT